jgi:hypothetical protein
VPDTKGRGYVQQFLDAYTNTFKIVGDGTTGTDDENLVIVGPGWNSSLPAELQVIKSPTNTVWIIGRIMVNGELDRPIALTFQKQFTLTPLSQYGKPVIAAKNETLADFKKAVVSPNMQDAYDFSKNYGLLLKIIHHQLKKQLLCLFSTGLAWVRMRPPME